LRAAVGRNIVYYQIKGAEQPATSQAAYIASSGSNVRNGVRRDSASLADDWTDIRYISVVVHHVVQVPTTVGRVDIKAGEVVADAIGCCPSIQSGSQNIGNEQQLCRHPRSSEGCSRCPT
jgi:hypothetical protein